MVVVYIITKMQKFSNIIYINRRLCFAYSTFKLGCLQTVQYSNITFILFFITS